MKFRHHPLAGLCLATLLPLTILCVAFLGGCGEAIDEQSGQVGGRQPAPGPVTMNEVEHDRWEIALVDMRIEKNDEFMQPEQTPLRRQDLGDFEGLEYYFPEPSLRFRTPFIAEAGEDTVRLTKRQGQEVAYIRRGKVRFSHQGQEHSLTVFGPADTTGGDYLWLPFFDATSGKATYPGGRYLDLTIDAEGMVDLDFNFAYNPLCDYNPERYNCTLPPMENTLPFAVEAGEKTLFPGRH